MDDFTPLNLFGSNDDPIEPIEAKDVPLPTQSEEPAQAEAFTSTEEPVAAAEEAAAPQAEAPQTAQETPEEPQPEEPAGPDKLDAIIETQQRLLESVEALGALFDKRILRTEHDEKVVDRMHKELQKYKEDMYAQLIRPILMDIIEVRDSILRISAAYLAKPEGEQNIPNKMFSDYSYDLQDILEKNGIEIYRSNPGDAFVPIRQRVIKKVPTADEALHGKVAESHSCGYDYNGKPISAEKISVYIYEAPIEETKNSEVNENG